MSILARGLGSYELTELIVVERVELVEDLEITVEELGVECELDDLAVAFDFGDIFAEVELEEADD